MKKMLFLLLLCLNAFASEDLERGEASRLTRADGTCMLKTHPLSPCAWVYYPHRLLVELLYKNAPAEKKEKIATRYALTTGLILGTTVVFAELGLGAFMLGYLIGDDGGGSRNETTYNTTYN